MASLARRGGNVTGLTDFAEQLTAKRLDLLREAVPSATRVGVLWNPASAAVQWQEAQDAARQRGVELDPLKVYGPDEFDKTFAVATQQQAHALLVLADPVTVLHQARLGQLALQSHLPAIHSMQGFVAAGGLLAYGPSIDGVTSRSGENHTLRLR